MNEEELLALLEQRYQDREIDFEQYKLEKAEIEQQSNFLIDFNKSVGDLGIFDTVEATPLWNNSTENYRLVESADTIPKRPDLTLADLGADAREGLDLTRLDNITYNNPNYKAPEAPETDIEKLHMEQVRQANESLPVTDSKESTNPTSVEDMYTKFMPFLNPYGSDIETELFSLGKFAGMEKGTKGKKLGIASSAVAATLGGARTLLSGFGQQKEMNKVAEEIRKQLEEKQYTPQTQYLNQNNRGGSL